MQTIHEVVFLGTDDSGKREVLTAPTKVPMRWCVAVLVGVLAAFAASSEVSLQDQVIEDVEVMQEIAERQFKQRVRAEVLYGSRGIQRLVKTAGLAVAGFGPEMPWKPPIPEPPPPPRTLETVAMVAAALLAVPTRFHPPAACSPARRPLAILPACLLAGALERARAAALW